jgi:hypothetical protein
MIQLLGICFAIVLLAVCLLLAVLCLLELLEAAEAARLNDNTITHGEVHAALTGLHNINGQVAGVSELPAEYLRYAVDFFLIAVSLWPPGTSFDLTSGAHAVAIVHKSVCYLSCTGKLEESARDTPLHVQYHS